MSEPKNQPKEPKYSNKENLVYCLNHPPLYFDPNFASYSEKEVMDLINDTVLFEQFINDLIDWQRFNMDFSLSDIFGGTMKQTMKNFEDEAFSLSHITIDIWSGLFKHYEELIPDEYKEGIGWEKK